MAGGGEKLAENSTELMQSNFEELQGIPSAEDEFAPLQCEAINNNLPKFET